jgi:short-subunit dehydrogenase
MLTTLTSRGYVKAININEREWQMSEHSGGTAVITGASSGFGAIFAEQLAGRGMDLILAGRDEARLAAVRRHVLEVAPGSHVELMPGDLGTAAGVAALQAQLAGCAIDLLVNNAGFGTYGAFGDTDAEREHGIVAVNVDALVSLTHAVLPGMLARGTGGIINVASVIARQPAPYQATYGASKAFVLSFSQALWAETRGTGVTVTALCPGPTATGFVGALGSDVSHTAIYQRLAAPEPVVAAGLRAFDRGRPLVTPGLRNKVMATAGGMSPGWLSALIGKRLLRPLRSESMSS